MRNYIEGWDKPFITEYKLVGSSLVVKYADGRKEVIPYNVMTENELLKKMEKQAYFTIRGPYVKFKKTFIFSLIATPIVLYCATISSNVSLLIALIGATCGIINIREYGKKIREIKKLEFFLANKEELCESVEFTKQKDSKNNDDFNINTLDNYSLSELKKLRRELQIYNNKSNLSMNEDNAKRIALKR